MDNRLRALNRFGLGARPGEAGALSDPRAWLHAQLSEAAARATDAAQWSARPVPLAEAATTFTKLREAQRARDQEALAAARQALQEAQGREVATMMSERLSTDVPFVERLVAFWSNHLCVSTAAKQQVAALAGHYERTAIRPNVLGTFEDLVLASARHPAMLFYLDNFQSVGPGSPAGRGTSRRGNARGLNENYARELLELHTVGVNGGYEQADVEELARILTGWNVAGLVPAPARPPRARDGRVAEGRAGRTDERVGFAFRPLLHEPGDKSVMGLRYRESGVREGESVIRDLCKHPSTATFVASKLVRHFVDDDPPPDDVARIASVFRDTGGDLREVAGSLVELENAWDPERRKFRAPQDWLIAVLRAFEVDEIGPRAGPILRQLRHPPWAPGSPAGYADRRSDWADPDSLMNRAELARTLAQRVAVGRRAPDLTRVAEVVEVAVDGHLAALLADRSISAEERVALAIGGPAFQWR